MSQSHPYETFRQLVPRDAPFELKPSPGRGWGAFATTNIQMGTVILKDSPLFTIYKPFNSITELDVRNAFNRLAPYQKMLFMCLRNNSFTQFNQKRVAFDQNHFELDGANVHGIFLLASRFNHSCVPNAITPMSAETKIALVARHDITVGDEITFSYKSNVARQSCSERRNTLQFNCICQACVSNTDFDELSQLRRNLIRGLNYLLTGQDMNATDLHELGATRFLILDPALKKASEEGTISLSRLWIMRILSLFLLEEENLLDPRDNMFDLVENFALLFTTKSNIRIARFVVKKRTLLEKLDIAFGLWGETDDSDRTTLGAMRSICGLSLVFDSITV